MKCTRAITELFSNISPLCVGSTVATNHDVLFQFICKLLSLHGLIILALLESAPPASRNNIVYGRKKKKKREKVC